MYERSAIVLERYFENLLGFNKTNNLKQNYRNYCDLFEKFNLFQSANTEEFAALAEFQEAEKIIEEIQNSEEKLYKKNAKLEYNRDLIFADINGKPEEIEKCVTKIESDISKIHANLVELREKFIDAVRNYNEKKSNLSKCKKNRKNAESEYNSIFEITKQNLENIGEEYLEIAKNFVTEENQEELVRIMTENGKDEKIPFNNSVMRSTATLGFDILQREAEIYLEVYGTTQKLISELLEGAVSVELHQKIIRNASVKLNFLYAEKDYVVQFLDYERITVIYGKRSHRTLMQEACEKFEADVEQINNLYSLLLKEIANKSTKKAYKELYNKSYLVDIEEKDARFKKEKNKMNMPVGTIMNSNYWRIEGIKNIYTVFYRDVSNVFGKDLVEFDLPKEQDIEEMIEKEGLEEVKEVTEVSEVAEEEESNNKATEAEETKKVEAKVGKTAKVEKAEEQEVEAEVANFEVVEEKQVEVKEAKSETKAKKPKRYTRKIVSETKKEVPVEKETIPEKIEISSNVSDVKEILTEEDNSKKVKNEKVKKSRKEKLKEEKLKKEQAKKEKAEKAKAEKERKEREKKEKTNKNKKGPKGGSGKSGKIEEKKVEKEEKLDTGNIAAIEALSEEAKNKTTKKNKVKRYTRTLKEGDKPVRPVFLASDTSIDINDLDNVEESEERDIFGEKYKDIERQIAEIDALDDLDNVDSLGSAEKIEMSNDEIINDEKASITKNTYDTDDIEYIDEDMAYEDEDIPYEEESIFLDKENEAYEELNLKKVVTEENKKAKKTSIFKKIMGLNYREKKEANG